MRKSHVISIQQGALKPKSHVISIQQGALKPKSHVISIVAWSILLFSDSTSYLQQAALTKHNRYLLAS